MMTDRWPDKHAANLHSQFGEDGILSAVFDKIGMTNRYCVDVGAADGFLFSNVRQFVEQGWSALLIESDEERFAQLAKNAEGQFGDGKIQCFNYKVEVNGYYSLDNLLEKAGAPVEFDLLSIDVDGQDYYIWNSLLHYKPRVVVIEYNPEAEPMYIPPLGGKGQAGWNAVSYVAAARGYLCICRTQTNLICVRRDILEALPGIVLEVGHDAQLEVLGPEPWQKIVYEQPIADQAIRPMDGSTSSATAQADKPVKIVAVISVPRLGFNDNWHATIKALTQLQIEVQLVFGVFWGQALTRGIQQAITNGADVILTIDYDTVFDVQHVIKVCQLLADHPEYHAIVPVQVKRECNELLFGLNGSRDFSQELTPISSGHFGLTAIDAHAFSRMPKPWFHDQPNADGDWGAGRIDADIFFWRQFLAAGLKIGLANQVRIGHLELAVSWPTTNMNIIRQSITDYRDKGQPEAAGGKLPIELLA